MGRKKGSSKSFEQKVRDLDEHFVNEVLTMSPKDLNAKLISLTKYQIELQEAKNNDEDLRIKKEAASEAGKVYSEDFKAIKMKQKYIFNLLGNAGDPVTTETSLAQVQKAVKALKDSGIESMSMSVNGGPEVSL